MGDSKSLDDDRNASTTSGNVAKVPDQKTTEKEWTSIAWSLGMPAADSHRPDLEAHKFAHRVQRKQQPTSQQILDHIGILVGRLRKAHPSIRHKKSAKFRWEGVPDPNALRFGLGAPQPGIIFGYRASTFSDSHLGLQAGFVTKDGGQPQPLERIAQIVPGVFWPFLVVECHDESMVSAQRACAAAATTCNNALAILARLTSAPKDPLNLDSSWGWTRASMTFSLAIHDKTAYLNAHALRNGTVQNFNTVKAYRLYDGGDVECMTARIKSILVWADYARLQSIMELLSALSRNLRTLPPPKTPQSRALSSLPTRSDSKRSLPPTDRSSAQTGSRIQRHKLPPTDTTKQRNHNDTATRQRPIITLTNDTKQENSRATAARQDTSTTSKDKPRHDNNRATAARQRSSTTPNRTSDTSPRQRVDSNLDRSLSVRTSDTSSRKRLDSSNPNKSLTLITRDTTPRAKPDPNVEKPPSSVLRSTSDAETAPSQVLELRRRSLIAKTLPTARPRSPPTPTAMKPKGAITLF